MVSTAGFGPPFFCIAWIAWIAWIADQAWNRRGRAAVRRGQFEG